MTVGVLAECRRLGIELAVSRGSLKYKGPAEALTPELLDKLRAHKGELLALLAANDCGRADTERKAWRLVMGTVH